MSDGITEIEHDNTMFRFLGAPAMPLRTIGEFEANGYNVPNLYAVDAEGQVWLDRSSRGVGLWRVTPDELVEAMEWENGGSSGAMREFFGMKPLLPTWARTALAEGWTPPATFDRSNYAADDEEEEPT